MDEKCLIYGWMSVKYKTDMQRNVCVSTIYNNLECSAFWVRVPCSHVCGYYLMRENFCFHRQVGLWICATAQYHNPDYQNIKSHYLVTLMSRIIINMMMIMMMIMIIIIIICSKLLEI